MKKKQKVCTTVECPNVLKVATLEKLQEEGGIAERWSKTQPVSAYAKNFELVWEKVKLVDTRSKDYTKVTWPAHAACRRNFCNEQKLETNSKSLVKNKDIIKNYMKRVLWKICISCLYILVIYV